MHLSLFVAQSLQDVQFFREATDVQFDETGNRKRKHRYGDEDEIEMEQQERKRRQMLNKEFRHFADKIAEAASSFVRRHSPALRSPLSRQLTITMLDRRHARGRQ